MIEKATMRMSAAAAYLGMHVNTLRKYVREGIIPSIKLEGMRLFPKALLDEWLRDSAIAMAEKKKGGD